MLYEHSNICFAKQRIECLAYWFAIYSIHQCRKGFLPRLFFAFCLGSGTEAYWGEAKRCTFWSRLSPEVIDSVLCLGSVRTEAIGDKYFFLKWLPHWLGECDEDHRRWAFQSDGTVKTQTCKHPASESAKTWLKSKKVYTLIGAQMSLAGKAEVQPCHVLFHHGHTLWLSRPRWPPFRRLLFRRRSPHLRQAPAMHRPQTLRLVVASAPKVASHTVLVVREALRRERESGITKALARGGRRVRKFWTLNKPYGFGC